jgi:hypothetical protein
VNLLGPLANTLGVLLRKLDVECHFQDNLDGQRLQVVDEAVAFEGIGKPTSKPTDMADVRGLAGPLQFRQGLVAEIQVISDEIRGNCQLTVATTDRSPRRTVPAAVPRLRPVRASRSGVNCEMKLSSLTCRMDAASCSSSNTSPV